MGSRTKVRIVKNKVAPPFKEAFFDIMYGTGISKTGELVDLGVDFGIINKSGAWFSYGETRLGQGRENVKLLFEKEKDLAKEIESKIFEAVAKKNEEELRAKGISKDEPAEASAPAEVKAPRAKRANIDIVVDD